MTDEFTLLSKIYIHLTKNTETLIENKQKAMIRKKSLNIISKNKKTENSKDKKKRKTFNPGFGSKKLGKEVQLEAHEEKSPLEDKKKFKEEDSKMDHIKEKEDPEKQKNIYKRKLPILKMEQLKNETHQPMKRKKKKLNIHSEGESEDGLQTPPRLTNDKHLETNENYKKLLQFESVNTKYGEISHSEMKANKIKEEALAFKDKKGLATLRSLFIEKKLESLEISLDKVVNYMNTIMEENSILKEQLKEKKGLLYGE